MAMFATSAMATESNDTITMKNGNTVIIDQNGEDVNVTVFNSGNGKMQKIHESSFTENRNVEFFISSPFFPDSRLRDRGRFRNHYPTFFFGINTLSGSVLGKSINHARNTKSWEWGVNIGTWDSQLGSGMRGICAALQFTQVHHHFGHGHILVSDANEVLSYAINDNGFKKSYLSYSALRMPIMFESRVQCGKGHINVAFGPYIEWRFSEHSRYFDADGKHTASSELNVNPFGIGLEARINIFGDFCIYGRAALTPLLKTNNPDLEAKFYPVAIGIGF